MEAKDIKAQAEHYANIPYTVTVERRDSNLPPGAYEGQVRLFT